MNLPDAFAVRVMELDIREGVAGDSSACPIAIAVSRKLGGLIVRIGEGYAVVYQGSGPPVEYLHDSARFVRRFDKRDAVGPRIVRLHREARQ